MLEDVIEERITLAYAREVYGVVVDAALGVDAAATAAARAAIAARRAGGPEARPAYLEFFLSRFGINEFERVGERELRLG